MAEIKSLCVYCAASNSVDESYLEAARDLGRSLADAGIATVFGAGSVGLMGAVANGALEKNGNVIGVIPEHLERRELGHRGVGEYLVVSSMHARKQVMFERSDAFCILPGGLGTLDEAFEVITWRQLRLHDKPIFLLNINGFWEPLLSLVEHLAKERFLHDDPGNLFHVVSNGPELISALACAPSPRFGADASLL